MSIFIIGLCTIGLVCSITFFKSKQLVKFSNDNVFKKFQCVYIAVYILAAGGDWLQGPYIYALYKHYGFSALEINQLFVAGYGSSLLFGTVVGSMADKYGRKKNCLLYGLLYIASCITKHYPNYNILLLGRILSGISTSILCSAFESWMVCEHHQRNFDPNNLPITFSQIVFGNSLVAIVSGVVAQLSVDKLGYTAPYDVAVGVFLTMMLLISVLWDENYGDKKVELIRSFKNASLTVIFDKKVQCLGIVQSLFEGSMYIFVLEWTPSLTPSSKFNTSAVEGSDGHRGLIPHGYIFASFMIAIMTGSMLFNISCKYASTESFLRPLLGLASMCFLLPVLYEGVQSITYACFVAFEVCVGAFWPSIGTLRSKYIPEQNRAAIMCLFRIPLNIIVIAILVQDLPVNFVFSCCFVFLIIASGVQSKLVRLCNANPAVEWYGSKQIVSLSNLEAI